MTGFTQFGGERIPVVDIDSHYTEPPDLWTSRAPARYRDMVPQIKKDARGHEHWVVAGDVPFGPLGFTVVRRDGGKAYGTISLTSFEELDEAAYDPAARLRLLDRLGIYQQIIYPNVAGFGSNRFMEIKDEGLRLACATIYNDAVIELQQVGQGRLFPQAVVPFWDVEAAVAEVQRIKKAGLTGITMTDKPELFGLPYLNDPHWDRFWATCAELELPVNFHIGAGGDTFARASWPGLGPQRRLALGSVALFLDNFRVIVNLLFSGLLERFPTLKFVSVESGIGWIPFVLEACEYQFDETCPDEREGLSLRPTEYFRRQIYASFWFEDFGPRAAIETIGEDNVMFETDFPHPTCLYPKAQEHITEVLTDLNPRVRRKVLRDTAVKVYHLPN
jgi:predicted TIM-barrel fold metal-dependent hydrolase